MTPPEFFGQNICGGCEGDGVDVTPALRDPRLVGPLPACQFCGGTGEPRRAVTDRTLTKQKSEEAA